MGEGGLPQKERTAAAKWKWGKEDFKCQFSNTHLVFRATVGKRRKGTGIG